jgi:hypothetical protein
VHRANLETMAASVGQDEVEIYENSGPMIWMFNIVGALFAIGAIVTVVVPGVEYFRRDPWGVIIMAGVCATIAAMFLSAAWILSRLRRKPVFVFGPDTLTARRLDRPLRWLDVAAYNVAAGGKLETALLIAEDATLPKKVGFAPRTQINKKKRTVSINCYGVRGMKPAAFMELIQRYLDAAHARRVLAPADGAAPSQPEGGHG